MKAKHRLHSSLERFVTMLVNTCRVTEKYSNEAEENKKGTTDRKMSFRSEDDSLNIIKLRHSEEFSLISSVLSRC